MNYLRKLDHLHGGDCVIGDWTGCSTSLIVSEEIGQIEHVSSFQIVLEFDKRTLMYDSLFRME